MLPPLAVEPATALPELPPTPEALLPLDPSEPGVDEPQPKQPRPSGMMQERSGNAPRCASKTAVFRGPRVRMDLYWPLQRVLVEKSVYGKAPLAALRSNEPPDSERIRDDEQRDGQEMQRAAQQNEAMPNGVMVANAA